MKKIAIISFATIFLTCLYPFDTSTYERSLDFSNTLSCSDVDITFRSSIWEETQDSAYELPNRQIALKDLGQEGGFTGETFTIDYETILSGNVRNILEISITLNSGHNAVLTATYNRSEDDEDEKDTYDLSEYFKATNVPLTSSSTNKLTFRIDGEEVCNKIEEYRYQQNRSATAWTIRTIDHCDEESFLEIKFTCTGIITTTTAPSTTSIPPATTTSTSISNTTTTCDPQTQTVCGDKCCESSSEQCCGNNICCDKDVECCGDACCEENEICHTNYGCIFWADIRACVPEAIYGEYSEEVELLRNFRDNVLSKTPAGQEIIKLYYQWSPAIVKAMENDEEFKEDMKDMIDGVLGLVRGEVE